MDVVWFSLKILAIVVLIALAIISYFGLDLVLSKMAEHDRWWSIVRKEPLSGQYNIMTRGVSPGGPFADIIESVLDWHYSGTIFEYKPGEAGRFRGYLSEKLGLRLVWFFRRYYSRNREYLTYEKKKGTNERELILKKRSGTNDSGSDEDKIFFFQTLLAAQVVGAETSDVPAVNAIVPFMMRTIDPNKAEFLTGKPEEVATNVVLSRARAYIAGRTYKQVLEESGDTANSPFIAFILKANGRNTDGSLDPEGLIAKHGIEIFAPYLVEVELTNKDTAFAKAAELRAVRLEEREAAKVEAETIGILGDAEALRAEKVFKAKGSVPNGGFIAFSEALAAIAQAILSKK